MVEESKVAGGFVSGIGVNSSPEEEDRMKADGGGGVGCVWRFLG